jgi:hypothetical protein
VFSFTLRALYPRGKSSARHPLDRRLCGSQSSLELRPLSSSDSSEKDRRKIEKKELKDKETGS